MADDDIIEEEVNLENVVDERTYKKAMEVISGVKKATKELKKSTKELKEVTKDQNLTGSGSMSFGAFGDPDQQALPKGKSDEKILAGDLLSGVAPASRQNTFKRMQEDLAKLKQQANENQLRSEQNSRENEFQELELRQIGAQMKMMNMRVSAVGSKYGMGAIGWMRGASGKAMSLAQGTIGKFLPIGIAITLATTIFSMVMDMFGDGGIFDVRKMVLDETKLYIDKELLNSINRGEIFIGNQYVQGQGIGTSGSSTRDKSYAHLTDRPLFQGK